MFNVITKHEKSPKVDGSARFGCVLLFFTMVLLSLSEDSTFIQTSFELQHEWKIPTFSTDLVLLNFHFSSPVRRSGAVVRYEIEFAR